jgi:hypothetical protein
MSITPPEYSRTGQIPHDAKFQHAAYNTVRAIISIQFKSGDAKLLWFLIGLYLNITRDIRVRQHLQRNTLTHDAIGYITTSLHFNPLYISKPSSYLYHSFYIHFIHDCHCKAVWDHMWANISYVLATERWNKPWMAWRWLLRSRNMQPP